MLSIYSSIASIAKFAKGIYSLAVNKNNAIKEINSKNIQEVIENYHQIQSHYQTNEIILDFYESKQVELVQLINTLRNKKIKDQYVNKWIIELKKTHGDWSLKIEELKNHQNVFKNFTDQFNKLSVGGRLQITDDEERELCNICEEKKRDRSLDCGHIYCEDCLNNVDNCPSCRLSIDRTKIRPVYL